MLFKQAELDRIGSGELTVAFRRWRRPTVVSGGRLRTAVGELAIEAVDRVSEEELCASDARQAGHSSVEALKAELARRSDGELYRIQFHLKGPDPRVALREQDALGTAEWEEVRNRLGRLDRASRTGPWTRQALEAIASGEGVRAGDLAPRIGQDKDAFKINVRKLRNLGLTESLGTGYRVSSRGQALLERLRTEP